MGIQAVPMIRLHHESFTGIIVPGSEDISRSFKTRKAGKRINRNVLDLNCIRSTVVDKPRFLGIKSGDL